MLHVSYDNDDMLAKVSPDLVIGEGSLKVFAHFSARQNVSDLSIGPVETHKLHGEIALTRNNDVLGRSLAACVVAPQPQRLRIQLSEDGSVTPGVPLPRRLGESREYGVIPILSDTTRLVRNAVEAAI